MPPAILDHVNIQTTDLTKSVKFYEHFLGLKPGFRPSLDSPGAWLYSESGQPPLIHLADVSGDEAGSGEGSTGAFHHFNVRFSGIDAYLAKVKAADDWYEVIFLTPELTQIQHRDPSGVMLEVMFIGESIAEGHIHSESERRDL